MVDSPEPIRSSAAKAQIPEACRKFVEHIVANATATAARNWPGSPPPRVDWESIWGAGDGATSVERAVGGIVTAASIAARDIADGAVPRIPAAPTGGLGWPGPVPPGRDASGGREPPTGAVGAPAFVDHQPGGAIANPVADVHPVFSVEAELASVDRIPMEPSPHRLTNRGYGWSVAFTWMRNIGAVALLFVAWQLWGTSISQHHDQHQLQSTFEASVHSHHAPRPTAAGPALVEADKVVPVPAEGSPVAQIAIPAIGLSEIVVSGTAEGDLAKGPGHYIGTAAPGQAGNVAIAGHRTTNGAPFNQLGDLVLGNEITLTTLSGERLTYVVSQPPRAVAPNDVAVLNDFGDNRITLTTCNPEYSSAQRLIVIGELKQPVPPVATKSKPHAYHIVNAKTASWDWALLPVVVLEAGVLLLLGLSNRRFAAWFGRIGRFVVLTPIWAAGLYVLFGTLIKFLPATF
jgi:LPXTG-site transpeptidase (sortase) family protein